MRQMHISFAHFKDLMHREVTYMLKVKQWQSPEQNMGVPIPSYLVCLLYSYGSQYLSASQFPIHLSSQFLHYYFTETKWLTPGHTGSLREAGNRTSVSCISKPLD